MSKLRRGRTGSTCFEDKRHIFPISASSSSGKSRTASAASAKKKGPQHYTDDDLEFVDDEYDEYDDGEESYDEYDDGYDDYDEPAPRRSSSKRSSGNSSRRSKSSAGKKKKKKSKSGGGFAVGLNLNRLNIALVVGGVIVLVLGVKEAVLSGKAESEPTQITLQELIDNGPGDNIYVTVTNIQSIPEETIVYGDEKPGGQITNYDACWIPVFPDGGERNPVKAIVKTTQARNDAALRGLLSKRRHTGLLVNDVESIGGQEKRLLQQGLPGANLDEVYILHESREPSGAGLVILYFVGGLALLAGGAFWIFLVRA